MSILINKSTRVICQGITGKAGAFHTKGCKEYGTSMVGGVTPGKGGETVEGVPVFDTVIEAVEKTGADATMIFVPAAFTADAILEAGLSLGIAYQYMNGNLATFNPMSFHILRAGQVLRGSLRAVN